MKIPQIYADEHGETHFGVYDSPDQALAMGPPPNPVGTLSDFGAVSSMCIFFAPSGTDAPPHNAPQPYIAILLAGDGEIVTSDGESRRFQQGDMIMCNDLVGKGHITRAITDLRLAFINRAQS